MYFAFIGGILLLMLFIATRIGGNKNLNIKAKTVGDGQHGTARWASPSELAAAYRKVPYLPQKWRAGIDRPTEPGILVGSTKMLGYYQAWVDTARVHALMIASPDAGKTAHFLYPNIEYALASGVSFIALDTKGDLYRNMGTIGERYYDFQTVVYDLRNPIRSDCNNLMFLVNRYVDRYKESGELAYQARAERYAKIIAKTIIMAGTAGMDLGANTFFYDAAEGLVTAATLVLAEFGEPDSRHIVSVIRLLHGAANGGQEGKSPFAKLLEKLPEGHKARWFAAAALSAPDEALASVLSTALSRMNAFLDSELEQMLCFDNKVTMEEFVEHPTAIYIVLPEEDETKYFAVSLMIQQMQRELIALADEKGGCLPKKVLCFYDELGTVPKIQGLLHMFSAIRSRNVSLVGILQGVSQLQETYGANGAETILDCCQVILAGGFGPMASTAEKISELLNTKTVMSGSVSTNREGSQQTLQMADSPLMRPNELRILPKGSFILMKTGVRPCITKLPLFTRWGIELEEAYEVQRKAPRKVTYAALTELARNIRKQSRVSESAGMQGAMAEKPQETVALRTGKVRLRTR